MIRIALLLMMLGHAYLTMLSWTSFGYAGFFPPFAQENTTQIFSDLVLASSLLHGAIAVDIHQRGDSALLNLPFLLATVLSGSFSSLTYFLWRPRLLEHAVAAVRGVEPRP